MAFIAAVLLIAAYLLTADGIPASELPLAAVFVVALIWLLVWAIATVFMPRTVSKPKYALAVLIVLTMAISIAAQGYRHNAEEKAVLSVSSTVDQKPPAECATAKNVEECADTLRKLGKNWWDAYPEAYPPRPNTGGNWWDSYPDVPTVHDRFSKGTPGSGGRPVPRVDQKPADRSAQGPINDSAR